MFGPCQYPEKLIPKAILLTLRVICDDHQTISFFMRHWNQGKPVPVHGNGHQRRSFLYIDDVVRAFEVILRSGQVGEIYNIGSPYELSVLDVVRDVAQAVTGSQQAVSSIEFVRDRPFNDQRYLLDWTKLRALGWTPQTSWADGLVQTVAWYRAHPGYWAVYPCAGLDGPQPG